MRIVFAGTPAFASTALAALHAAGHDVALVLTRPDKPAGRGMRLAESEVSRLAASLGIETYKPVSFRDPGSVLRLRDAAPEAMVVAAYGLLLPPEVLAIPRHGCLNIHASLLPRWRGAAPIQRALLAGDATTGVSIMQMDAGLDTGPVLLEVPHPIEPRDTAGSLTQALAQRGADAIVRALAAIDTLPRTPQDGARATHAPKVGKTEARIDWSAAAAAIDRQVRAFNPAPGAETTLGEALVKIWDAEPAEGSGAPGEVLAIHGGEVLVACGKGSLRVRTVQRSGGRSMPADALLRGARAGPGARFGSAAPVA